MFSIVCNKQNIHDDFKHVSLLWKRALQQREEALRRFEKQRRHVQEAVLFCSLLDAYIEHAPPEAVELMHFVRDELQQSLRA